MLEETKFQNDVLSFNNITSIILYIKNNYIQFLLLLLVIFIIVLVDHISNINMLLGIQSSFINIPNQNFNNKKPKIKKIKK